MYLFVIIVVIIIINLVVVVVITILLLNILKQCKWIYMYQPLHEHIILEDLLVNQQYDRIT